MRTKSSAAKHVANRSATEPAAQTTAQSATLLSTTILAAYTATEEATCASAIGADSAPL